MADTRFCVIEDMAAKSSVSTVSVCLWQFGWRAEIVSCKYYNNL